MNKLQLKALIKESIKEVLNEGGTGIAENMWVKELVGKKITKAFVKTSGPDLIIWCEDGSQYTLKTVAGLVKWDTMQERRKMSLKENDSLDPKLAGYWVLKNNTQAISMYPSKQEAEMAFKNRGTKYGSHALNSGWKIVPAEEFVSTTNGVLDKHTMGHPNYISPYRRPDKERDRLDWKAQYNREMER